MSWKNELQDASFRGIYFECSTIKDAVSKAQAIHQAPFSDEASIEDVGKDPRKISINAIFTGNTYKADSDQLIDALNSRGSGVLIHPIYGMCNASVANYSIDHEADNVNACTINIEFIVGKEQQNFFTPVTVNQNITDTKSIIAAPATALQSELAQLNNEDSDHLFHIVNRIRTGINTARTYLNLAKQNIDDMLSPPSYITAFVDDLGQLLTFDTNISALTKWRDLSKRITRFSTLFENDEKTTLQQTWRACVISSHVSLAQTIIQQTRTELSHNQTASSFTPLELALVRQSVRKAIQQAINEERRTTASLTLINTQQIQVYKNLADEIHLQIQELIEQRPPLTTTTITLPCTLHWLAHQLYGDYTRANEIQRLNPRLNNPALLLKGMELNVYAR